MKILYVVTRLSTGGAEKALYTLLSGGLGEVGEPVVLSLLDEGTYGPRIREGGIDLYTLNMRRGVPNPRALARLHKAVREIRPDLIQGWMYHGNLAASVAAGMAHNRPRIVWGIRQTLYALKNEKTLSRQVIRANRRLSAGADAIVYNSNLSRLQHEQIGFQSRNGKVIPNGFDTNQLRPCVSTRRDIRRRLGVPENGIVIGHVARLHPMKNHVGFLEAASRVAEINDRIHVMIVGRDVVRDRQEFAGAVPGSVQSRFHWLGERSDVPDLLSAMDVLCLSSSWGEAFPNVLGEAMATGVPCVTTDVGESARIVGSTGVAVPPDDTDALAAGLERMVSKTEYDRLQLGVAARSRIGENFALDRVIADYGHLYKSLMQTE